MKRKPKDAMPKAVWEGTFTLFGVTLRCATLDNGERVIRAEDMARFFKALQEPGGPDLDMDEVRRFNSWKAGQT